MIFIEKGVKKGYRDPGAISIQEDLNIIGISSVRNVFINRIFFLEANIEIEKIRDFTENVLIDSTIEEYSINDFLNREGKSITITLKPGVFDKEGKTLEEVAGDLDYSIDKAKTATRYIFQGDVTREEMDHIKRSLLCNDLIQKEIKPETYSFPELQSKEFKRIEIPIREASNKELLEISDRGMLALNLREMRKIKEHFTEKGREPTDLELETIAQTWSEHCFHKTFKSPLIDEKGREIGRLYDFIKDATQEISSEKVLLAFSDNAGAIEFDEEYAITYKAETHNHPSALEPYGGAATGVGGVIRDTLGCGLGAKPVASTDVFCFGDIDMDEKEKPDDILHPRRITRGVVEGVRDYGNNIGIPTVGGAVYFDSDFNHNPLVYVGNVGIIKKEHLQKEVKEGDYIVYVGGKTGRDGIHGATFSSLSLDKESQEVSGGAVQIGNPIEEKRMLDVLMKAKNKELYRAITDCGAGGFSSAVGEMAEKVGAEVELSEVPLKYRGLSYWEIWVSESQERMVLAVPPENFEKLKEIFEEERVEYAKIGTFGGGDLTVKYRGNTVGELDTDFMFNQVPLKKRKIKRRNFKEEKENFKQPEDLETTLKKIISGNNVGSRRWIIQQYDHEVQGGSVIKPFSSYNSPSDGVVVRPRLESSKAFVLGFGINPFYGKNNPYRMALSVIDESLRNLIASGGRLDNAALLDNFCFGDVSDPEILGDLYETARGCYNGAIEFKTPFISGKDSLNNYFIKTEEKGEKVSIPPTLLISSISVIEDFRYTMTSNFKKEGSFIYLIGRTGEEIGGSEYARLLRINGVVPGVNTKKARIILERISEGIREDLFNAVHDISNGGLAVALTEMCFSNFIGCRINIEELKKNLKLREDVILFSESNSRFLVEVPKNRKDDFESFFENINYSNIGMTEGEKLIINNGKGQLINLPVKNLFGIWESAVQW